MSRAAVNQKSAEIAILQQPRTKLVSSSHLQQRFAQSKKAGNPWTKPDIG